MSTEPSHLALSWYLGKTSYLEEASAVCVLRASPLPILRPHRHKIRCEQRLRPISDVLVKEGYSTPDDLPSYDLVLFFGSRATSENAFYIARAFELLQAGGTLIAAIPNKLGEGQLRRQIEEVFGDVESESKAKAKVFIAKKGALCRDITGDLGLATPRLNSSGLATAAGIFNKGEADKGSLLLIENLPQNFSGRGADLCAGNGILSKAILETNSRVQALHLFEIDRVALACAELTLHSLQRDQTELFFYWADVTQGVGEKDFDWIVMNPPFHSQNVADPELGIACITAASRALKAGGKLYMVANKKLPYEESLRSLFTHGQCLADRDGYKVYECER